ncbi:lectin [Guyanagaster necrorhizus]|uniref:Lectin n=1 Tax=Guyanagaster necrorhizus TaxID=856835 RepID=A0A9P7VWA3_9AGAR|nr:lectin [Guyanagaster necrorhizus MCA 3950]KAG7448134.1 lectin [Guyanagaster necrorhizus MCA 3950]
MFSQALLLLPVVLSAVLTTAFPASEKSLVANAANTESASLAARAAAQPLTLANSNWIWTGEEAGAGGNAPIGSRPFRKTIPHTSTKCPVCATILIATDNLHTLYVNGAQVGSGASFSDAQVYTVGLEPESDNVIAVNGTNTGGPAGLIATVLVDYADGTTETFVTDASWKTLQSAPPAGFENPSLDDSAWIAAVGQGMEGVSPWGQTTLPSALDITQSNWIWTNETSAGNAPVGHRAFRKTVTSPYGKGAVCAKVVITVDNAYTLYANGESLGSGTDFQTAQAYSVPQLDPDQNVFAVDGQNTGGPAGVIATILVAYNDGTSVSYVTDTTWKTTTDLPTGFQLPATDDSTWSDATIVGQYGSAPWGAITVPDA